MKARPSLFLLISILILGLATVYGCGGGGGGGGGGITLASVTPLYSGSGIDWNDYIKNDGTTLFDASDTAATGTETGGYDVLLHGGEMRAFGVTGKSSCTGLAASDSMSIFAWTCDSSSSPVRMISTGLADGKYLSDLIDFTSGAWKQLSVTVTDGGTTYGTTPASTWWNNPIIADNDGGALATSGNIYIVTTSTPGAGYSLQSDKIAMLIQPGITMQGPGTGSAVVTTGFAVTKFLWLEGSIDASGDDVGVFWSPVFSVLRGVQIDGADTGTSMYGLYLSTSDNGKIYDVTSSNNAGFGIWLLSSNNNDFEKIVSVNNTSDSVRLQNSTLNKLYKVISNNNGANGILLINSNDNSISDVAVFANGSDGINLSTSTNNTFSNVTTANNKQWGVRILTSSDSNLFSNISTVNNDFEGIVAGSSDNNKFINIAVANNGNGVRLVNSNNNFFGGVLKVGNNSAIDCTASGTAPGLIGPDCTNSGAYGSTDYPGQLSTAVLHNGVDMTLSFIGKAVTDDSANISDVNGSAFYDSIADWTSFQNDYRGWGRDGAAFASSTNQGSVWTGTTARIWDWSLPATGDTGDAGSPVLHDTLAYIPPVYYTHTWSTAVTSTFLGNTVEVIGDGIGNDNSLCESDETCIITRNIGSYQGHGPLKLHSTFSGSVISSVTLMEYTTNGY